MRPRVALLCVRAPNELSAGSLFARSRLPATCTAVDVAPHETSPSMLDRWRDVAFLELRNSVMHASVCCDD
eukprot:6193820-Pleurochrysis_carterae.AAC.1